MHTMTIKNITDDFYPHFKALIESLASDSKLEYEEEGCEDKSGYPEALIVSSVEEVRHGINRR